MALILCIETATDVCSVALNKEGHTIGLQTTHLPRVHNQVLATSIAHIVETTGSKMSQISAVAVSIGPGSYTGLRIGLAMGKGLCYALDLPLIAINTLEALAESVRSYKPKARWLCPTIDARGAGIYWGVVDASARLVQPVQRGWVTADQLKTLCPRGSVCIFGSGAAKVTDVLIHQPEIYFLEQVVPTAGSMGRLAQEKFQCEEFEELADYDPLYVHPKI